MAQRQFLFVNTEGVYEESNPASDNIQLQQLALGVSFPLGTGVSAEFAGGLKIGTATAAEDGIIRWTGSDFEGRMGGVWTSLTLDTIFTAENAQDAVGNILADSAAINFVYDDALASITASIVNNSITYAMLQEVSATSRVLGRITAGAGNAEELTGTQVTTLLISFVGDSGAGGTKGIVPAPASGDAAAEKFLKADGTWSTLPAVVGYTDEEAQDTVGSIFVDSSTVAFVYSDVTPSITATVPNASITYAKIQDVSVTNRILGRTTTGAGVIEELTGTQTTALLTNVVGDSGSGGTKGLVPAPAAGDAAAEKFLKADGVWTVLTIPPSYTAENAQDDVGSILVDTATVAFTYSDGTPSITANVPNASITYAKIQNVSVTARILGRTTAGAGVIEELSGTQTTALLTDFVGDSGAGGTKGLVPAPASGDTAAGKFLKADGTWTVMTGYTDEEAQDAIGAILLDSSTIDFTYSDGTPSITAIIIDDSVTYAKLQNVTATNRLLGRWNSGAGDVEEITLSTGLRLNSGALDYHISALTADGTPDAAADYVVTWDASASVHKKVLLNLIGASGLTTKGDLLVHNGTNDIRLPVGANGHVLVADSTETAGVKWNATNIFEVNEDFFSLTLVGDTSTLDLIDDGISNDKLAVMSGLSLKGNVAGGPANPSDLTGTQATTLLTAVVGDSGSGGTKGLVPAPASGDAAANKFLKADGTWAVVTSFSDEGAQDAIGTILLDSSTIDFTYNDGTPSITAIVIDASITYAKIQNISATNRLLGRSTAAAGVVEEITVGGDLTQSGSTFTIANDAVTYAKMQNVTATSRFLGRITAAAGDVEELTGTQATTLLNNVVGDSGAGGTKGLVPAPASGDTAAGKFLKADGTWTGSTRTVAIGFDGGGSTITTGAKKAYWSPEQAGTLTKWRLLADQSGSIVVDIWRDSYANFPPTIADVITASDKPTITTATKAEGSSLTGWTTAFSAGDVFEFVVNSVTTLTKVTLYLTYAVA